MCGRPIGIARLRAMPDTTICAKCITKDRDDIDDEWNAFVNEQREKELNDIITEENLRPDATRHFIEQSFTDGYVTTTGVAITKVLPPMPLFGAAKVNREEKKNTVLAKLIAFFYKYFNI